MAHRTPAYVTCVILAAILLSIPQLMNGMSYLDFFRYGIPITYPTIYPPWYTAPFCENHFWSVKYDHGSYVFTRVDPETGDSKDSKSIVGNGGYGHIVYGNQLWQFGNQHAYLVNGDRPRKLAMTRSPQWVSDSLCFLIDGMPAELTARQSGPGISVSSFTSESWVTTHDVVLPDINRHWMFGKSSISFQSAAAIACIRQKNRLHCFIHASDRLLYREGLNLRPIARGGVDPSDEPANAMQPANADDDVRRWTLVREQPSPNDDQSAMFGMLIDGDPAALIVDKTPQGDRVGEVYRFDGKSWSIVQTVRFPFGATWFKTVCRDDGERSYIIVTTTAARCYLYSVSAAGVKQTFVDPVDPFDAFRGFRPFLVFPCYVLVLAAIHAVITSGFMSAFTHPEYGYGVQKVQLADATHRGVARAIDLALIAASTYIVARVLTYRFDVASLVEALTLEVAHPTVSEAIYIGLAIFMWIGFTILVLVYIQGKWGVTPGKWCCGLRVFRTTLKPCGFLRSLAREVTLAFESCNLHCWAPGIVAIALTDRRQRLGDWAADTIVIRWPRSS